MLTTLSDVQVKDVLRSVDETAGIIYVTLVGACGTWLRFLGTQEVLRHPESHARRTG